MKTSLSIIFLLNVCHLIGQDTLLVRDVFDFDINDEFYYKINYSHLNGYQVERIFIKDK